MPARHRERNRLADMRPMRERVSPGAAIAVTSYAVITVLVPIYLIGALFPMIKADFALGSDSLGLCVATYFVATAILAAYSGKFGDLVGGGRLLRWAAALAAVALVAASAANGFIFLMIFCATTGGCNGVAQAASNVYLIETVDRGRQNLAQGIKQAAVPLTTLACGLAVPLIVVHLGWRAPFVIFGLSGLLSAYLVSPHVGLKNGVPIGTVAVEAIDPQFIWPVVLSATFAGAAGNAMATFIVDSTVADGLTASSAGLLLFGCSLVGAALRVLLGMLQGKWAPDPLLGCATLMLIGTVSLALIPLAGPTVLVFVVLLSFCSWSWAGLMIYSIVNAYPTQAGRASGMVHAGLACGASAGPLIFGLIAGHYSYELSWYVAAVWSGIGAVCALVAARRLSTDRRTIPDLKAPTL